MIKHMKNWMDKEIRRIFFLTIKILMFSNSKKKFHKKLTKITVISD
jgi:hypothetical protein